MRERLRAAADAELGQDPLDVRRQGGGDTACSGSVGPVVLDPNTYTVSETAGTGTDLSHNTSRNRGDCAANG